MNRIRDHVVLLVGGVGGAKLAIGMAKILPHDALTIIVNTADDFEHLGLSISPDLDTVMYTLAEIANPETGWGLINETQQAIEMLRNYGGPDWFQLGDRDLGTHLMRTMLLKQGLTLTEITHTLCMTLKINHRILPVTDGSVRTWLETDVGRLPFQEYFVRERWQPVVKDIEFVGAKDAVPSPETAAALEKASLIVFGPSNPFLSIDPMLAIPGIRSRIESTSVPVVAVSPIIGGQAVKGPAAKLLGELGYEVSALTVAEHYNDLLTGFILDEVDAELCDKIAARRMKVAAFPTYMKALPDKIELATTLLNWTEENVT